MSEVPLCRVPVGNWTDKQIGMVWEKVLTFTVDDDMAPPRPLLPLSISARLFYFGCLCLFRLYLSISACLVKPGALFLKLTDIC